MVYNSTSATTTSSGIASTTSANRIPLLLLILLPSSSISVHHIRIMLAIKPSNHRKKLLQARLALSLRNAFEVREVSHDSDALMVLCAGETDGHQWVYGLSSSYRKLPKVCPASRSHVIDPATGSPGFV